MTVCRLHYRWTQLEADRAYLNVGSPLRPLPSSDRVLHLHPTCGYRCKSSKKSHWEYLVTDSAHDISDAERKRFASCASTYSTIHYHTFLKDGGLKLTEVELFFLSQHVPISSASDWAVIYLGVGDGERFRYIRDTFFPKLWVIAFDPAPDTSYWTDEVKENAERWRNDGTDFYFYVRKFDIDTDVAWIKDKLRGKKILLISDIRSDAEAHIPAGTDLAIGSGEMPQWIASEHQALAKKRRVLTNNIEDDNRLQLQAIRAFQPVSSLVKFKVPDLDARYYEYMPGQILIQTYMAYYGSEVRLLITGVPKEYRWYDAWEIHEKMIYFHEHLRGQVYEVERPSCCTAGLDSCFDCSVLISTVSQYAKRNSVDPNHVLRKIADFCIYMPGWLYMWDISPHASRHYSHRFWDVATLIQNGHIMQAIFALEKEEDKEHGDDIDWADISQYLSNQPGISKRIVGSLQRPASRLELVSLLGSLSDPLTRVNTMMNGLSNKSFISPWPIWMDS